MDKGKKIIKLTQKTISTNFEEMDDGSVLPVNPWTIGVGVSGNRVDANKQNHVAVIRLLNSESKFHVELVNYLNSTKDYHGEAESVSIYCFGEDEINRLLVALETSVFLLRSKLREKSSGRHEMMGSGFSEIDVEL